jgi:UDP-N-acetylglucosamine--N-acetylmuramyl-(pentapeptide) pyrophosphoryl-undecaprenol N-acetylglucosamine transferase
MTRGNMKKRDIERTIVFTGGGTGGHVFPGLAVLEELKKEWNGEILWVGSKHGMERKIIEKAGVSYYGIPCGKLRRYFSIKNILDLFRILFGIIASIALMRKVRPTLLFSKGGYVSVPPVIAAGRRKIPVITHESDSDPGLATRLNAKHADKICISFPETLEYLKPEQKKKAVVTGNPIREDIKHGDPKRGKSYLGAPEMRKIIFILGGSQGALQINMLVEKIIGELTGEYFVVHQVGKAPYKELENEFYKTFSFIGNEMPDLYAAADLIVSRAGANTLAEISATAKPCVLIPLMKGAGRGDQVKNAELYKSRGAARVLAGEEATPENLLNVIQSLLKDPDQMKRMGTAAAEIMPSNAAENILGVINSLLSSR